MKIRIKDSSIRFRLSKSDISTLSEEGCLLSECQIAPGNSLKYMISVADNDKISLKMKYHTINVKVPYNLLQKFYLEDQIGFNHTVPNGLEEGLYILVEKDFQCLIPRPQEDLSNLYANPQAKQ